VSDRADAPAGGFRRGLLCNLLNPKAAAFFVALMPQFLGDHPPVGDALVMSAIAVLVSAIWSLVLANVVGTLRKVFSRQAVRRGIDAVTGTALIALGLRLATSRADSAHLQTRPHGMTRRCLPSSSFTA
jgi:threonine/homoserine/homoserine lactone efflux protein